ncbi:MAG: hypothetical protein M1833_004921 [Piccolia ochrophora]|nr:MAG: hypothetical protein M1833_004921 [Piccolia ochrophora]
MLSLLSPSQDGYRSMPSSPYPLDTSRALTPRDVEDAMQHARMGIEGDYFSGGPRYSAGGSSSRPRSPYPRYETESYGSNMHDLSVQELVRKTNLAVSLANNSIREKSQYALLHPMMTRDGRFPSDFSSPKTINAFKSLEGPQLDRILQAYHLPLDLSSAVLASAVRKSPLVHPCGLSSSGSLSLSSSRGCGGGGGGGGGNGGGCGGTGITSTDVRNAKVLVLYEFLGAGRLVEYERLKRGVY